MTDQFKGWPSYGRLLNGVVVPCTMHEWAREFENFSKRLVATDYIDGAHISTVFLGLNHGFHSRPLWFETMVFDLVMFSGKGAPELQWRYEMLDEAREGHQRACEWVREHIKVLRAERREKLLSEASDEHHEI